MTGQIIDTESGDPVPGATVMIVDGPNAGQSSTSDESGRYGLAGLQSAGFTLRVSAARYSTASQGVTVTANQNLNVMLTRVWQSQTMTFVNLSTTTEGTGLFGGYNENGMMVLADISLLWMVNRGEGLLPDIIPPGLLLRRPGQTDATGSIFLEVANHALFKFTSVAISQPASAPATFVGQRRGQVVYRDTMTLRIPVFEVVRNPHADVLIDNLTITLTAAVSPITSRVLLDNIEVLR